jgi:uncharacterized repeat protein (TIGR01451 family)
MQSAFYTFRRKSTMTRLFLTSLSTIALSAAILGSGHLPVIGQLVQPSFAQVPAAKQAIQLRLAQAKKVTTNDGYKLVSVTSAKPGDTIVYSVTANNISDRAVNKLRIDQKIRPGTVYVANSATPISNASLMFSIDGGKSFSPQPIVNKKPAPANAYTNIRWSYFGSFAPKSKSNVSYEVKIR